MGTRKDAFNDDLLIFGETLLRGTKPIPTRLFIQLEVSLALFCSLERLGSGLGSLGS